MLQSKAGVENRDYKAQKAILADVDAGKISKEDFFAHAEEMLKARVGGPAAPPATGAATAAPKPAAPKAAPVLEPSLGD